MVEVYTSTYSHIDVYESTINDIPLMRRCDDDWVNATQILKIAGFGKAQRTRILEREVHKFVHRKVQGGHGKFQGTWVPLDFAKELAVRHKIPAEELAVLFYDPTKHSPLKSKKSLANGGSSSGSSNPQAAKQLDKKRQLKVDTSNDGSGSAAKNARQGRKLNSPQKIRKDSIPNRHSFHNSTSAGSTGNAPLPPTFGMFNDPAKRLHAKSKSASNIFGSVAANTPPSSAPSMPHPGSKMDQYYQYQQIQSHQLEAQRELQLLQKQQDVVSQPQVPHNSQHQNQNQNQSQNHYQSQQQQQQQYHHQRQQHHHQQQQHPHQQQHQQQQGFNRPVNGTNVPYFVNHRNNHSIQSVSDDSHQQIRESSDTSTSSAGYMIYDKNSNNLPQRLQLYNSTKYNDQQLMASPQSQILRHNRHHSSPHIMTSQNESNVSFDNSIDIQDFYTTQLLSFFINDSPVPEFLYDPPSDFDINKQIDDEGHTPLHWASALAAVDIIKLLVDHNADTLILNDAGMNALSKLINFSNSYDWKNFNIILPLLKHCLVVPDANQRTPIHYLMELSSTPNKQNSSRYYFHEILSFIKVQQKEAERFNNNVNNERQLLQVLINHSDINGDSALHLAMKANSRDLVKDLLLHGADASSVGVHNIPPDLLKEVEMEKKYMHMNLGMSHNADLHMSMNMMNVQNNSQNHNNDINSENNSQSSGNGVYQNMQMYPQMADRHSAVNSVENGSFKGNPNQLSHIDELGNSDIVHSMTEAGDHSNANRNNNPFLISKNESVSSYKSKGTPQTIILQRTPGSQIDVSEDKENIFDTVIKTELDSAKELPGTLASTPSKMEVDNTFSIVDSDLTNDKTIDEDDDSLMVVHPSKISKVELDNFMSSFPSKISQLKTSLESKNDHLHYNIETINKLNSEISSITVKNSKCLKKLAKVTRLDPKNIDFMGIANASDDVMKDFISTNVSKIESNLDSKSDKLLDLCERSQALDVAKLVNIEENSIVEDEGKAVSNKLELAIQLTLLQITRRKIMEQTLELYLNEGVNDEDFCFDEDAVDINITADDADDFRMMRSKISVYKKLISSICGLPASEINGDLLNGIEKVLS